MMSVVTFALMAHAAQAAIPVQKLEIGFDLDAATLRGEAELTIPAGLSATLYLHFLEVKELTVDGVATEREEGGKGIRLEEANKERLVRISYTKQFESGEDSGAQGD